MSAGELQEKFFDDITHTQYHLKHIPMKIRELNEYYIQKRLLFDTEYQRREVWPSSKKRLLIDSVMRKYDISMIFLRQQINKKDGRLYADHIKRHTDGGPTLLSNGRWVHRTCHRERHGEKKRQAVNKA